MRNYNIKINNKKDGFIVKLSSSDTTIIIRNDYYMHFDDYCYWCKIIDGDLYRSNDNIFDTQKQDSSHLIIYLK